MIRIVNGIRQCYMVFDVHGCYDLLMDRLAEVGFNWIDDTLIIGGDMVDRGPKSLEVLRLTRLSNVIASLGNHEQMAYDYCKHNISYGVLQNGGDWLLELDEFEKEEVATIVAGLPQAIQINDRVGVVHAAVPFDDWDSFNKFEFNGLDMSDSGFHIWSRDKIAANDETVIANIEHVFVGHTPVQRVEHLGNVHYCDTGAVYTGRMTIVRLTFGDDVEIEYL